MRSILLDTGALVALVDRSEKNHRHCVDFLERFTGSIFTTEPVLTEALYLFESSLKAQKACVNFIVNGGASLVPQSIESLSRAVTLMEKYHDTPMDFADATLVVLAEELRVNEVFTLDIRGFSTYRISGKKAFRIWPELHE
ncbi:MAG: PIN domain-containing protein [Nitrospiraceae bacterium]|nr:MAG: PIN domain-containing protein [Nitrospiraceae bacterium]